MTEPKIEPFEATEIDWEGDDLYICGFDLTTGEPIGIVLEQAKVISFNMEFEDERP